MGVIVIILVTIIVKHNDIYKLYKVNKISKDVVNCINGEFSDIINDYTVKEYEIIHKSNKELNHYDVTEIINVYINSILNGINIYIKNSEEVVVNKAWEHREINKANDLEFGKDIWMKYYVIDYAVGESFTSLDVRNYKDESFKDMLIEKLKDCLDYEEKDNKIEWYINSTEDKRIELPYNCYIDYKAYNYMIDNNFKNAISIIDKTEFNLDKLGNIVTIKYIMNDGEEKSDKIDVSKWDDGKYRVSLSILGKYINSLAECTLSNHTVDRWTDEFYIERYRGWQPE